jgi:hypothetical protein
VREGRPREAFDEPSQHDHVGESFRVEAEHAMADVDDQIEDVARDRELSQELNPLESSGIRVPPISLPAQLVQKPRPAATGSPGYITLPYRRDSHV